MSIQGQLLELTVVGCCKLRDTEWISRQDPFVCLEYATTKFRTRTCTDGGKNPIFQEKTVIPLIEGLREIAVSVWNSNTLVHDDFIGRGRIQLQKVLTQGYDDSYWAIQSNSGKHAGDVKLIMYFSNAGNHKPAKAAAGQMSYAPPTAPGYNPAAHYAQPYYDPSRSIVTPPDRTYPASYPPAGYPPIEPAVGYPPPTLQQTYPPPSYPPAQTYPPVSVYPPPPVPYSQPCYPPAAAPYPGIYPPPPY